MSFTYRGTTSDSMFFNVTERQVYNAPAFDVNAIEVPGRSGDVLNSQQRFKNKTLVYTGFIRSSDFPGNTQWERLSRGLRNIKAWICGDAGKYHDLTDDYDPGFIRRAFVSGETAINILFDRPDGATITITFLAEPFMYEVSEPIEVPESDTASGSIAAFEGVDAPLKSLKFSIAPSQDLHGYDYPWPAGGGKNLFDKSATDTDNGYVENKYVSGSGALVSDSDCNISEYIKTKPSQDYIVQGVSGSNISVAFYDSSKTFISAIGYGITWGEVGNKAFTTPANCEYIRLSIVKANINITMLEFGSTATTYAPYSNICPISGWTQANVTRTGKNLFDKSATDTDNGYAENKYVNGRGVLVGDSNCNISEYISIKAEQTYTVYGVSGSNVGFAFYDGSKVLISALTYSITWGTIGSKTFTTPKNCAFIRLSIIKANVNITQLELGSTATAYEPYRGTPITIALGQTVYGGTVDALAGKCYARPYYASYSGQALVGPWISSHDKYVAGGTPTTGAQVVDMGGTETTLSLTPVSVNSLLGQNNIWCNTGETEVGYIVPTENPTQWPSQPRLEITMSGAGTLTVNGKTWSIGAYTGTLICDSEIMDWYDAGALKNSLVSGDGFPEFVPGDNVITYTGGITKVVATPRWRTL